MINEELKNIIEGISKKGDMLFLNPTTEEKINSFETNNNIVLPKQFKDYLLISDGGELFLPAGIQFYGISHKPIIDVNDTDRPSDKYVVIGALSNGDPILFEKGTERIMIYNHDCGVIEDDEQYDDLYSFLKDLYNILGLEG